jgi:hypothetical protein
MRRLTPLHSRLNVLPRPDIANAIHGTKVEGGVIDNAIWGSIRVESPIQYQTPAKRDSFAFGEVLATGTPASTGERDPPVLTGDIIGFDLWQIGHELDADAFYPDRRTFYTLPWTHALCRFSKYDANGGAPYPCGDWLMFEPDEVRTARWLIGSDGTLTLPGGLRGAVATNSNQKSKVRATVGKFLAAGLVVHRTMRKVDWKLHEWYGIYNPLDAVTINLPGHGQRAFVRWDDVEQAVEDVD